MATILMYSLQTGKAIQLSRQNMLLQVERAEKKNFARHEAIDFGSELKKHNTVLVVVFDSANIPTQGSPALAAYVVFVHSKPGNVVTLHKICVLVGFRRQGVARKILASQMERLKKQGSSKMNLWVAEQNVPARQLYERFGFEEVNKVQDYYAPGRTGIHMALGLESS